LITSGGVVEALKDIPSGDDGGNSNDIAVFEVQAYLDTENLDGNPYSDYVLDESVDTVELYNTLRTAYDEGKCIRFILRVTYPEGHRVSHHMEIKEIDVESGDFYLDCSYCNRTILMFIGRDGFVEISSGIDAIPTESSKKLITSGGVYTAIGDVETSLENIIKKYGLGGVNV
jgi:hypothetical protein